MQVKYMKLCSPIEGCDCNALEISGLRNFHMLDWKAGYGQTAWGRCLWIFAGTHLAAFGLVERVEDEAAFWAYYKKRYSLSGLVPTEDISQAKAFLTAWEGAEALKWPFLLMGTHFQRAVWRALLSIPRGQTISYGALAQRVGRPRALRAIGTAVGKNPIGLFIPCHRVVGQRGLGGYAWGIELKKRLLRQEGVL